MFYSLKCEEVKVSQSQGNTAGDREHIAYRHVYRPFAFSSHMMLKGCFILRQSYTERVKNHFRTSCVMSQCFRKTAEVLQSISYFFFISFILPKKMCLRLIQSLINLQLFSLYFTFQYYFFFGTYINKLQTKPN